MILYHGDGTRSQRVRWLLEELGLDYRLEPLPFPPRLLHPSYLDINPIGSLPFFVDGEVRMTESMGICQYILATYGPSALAIAPSERGYTDYLQFCWYGEATLMPPLGTIIRYTRIEPPERQLQQAVDDARAIFAEKLRHVEDVLREKDYIAADRFTTADISVAYVLGLATALGEGHAISTGLAAYHHRLAERPAYIRACHTADKVET